MNRKYFLALLELVVLTYAAGFLGLVTADGFDILSLAAWKAAAVAAIPPVLVVIYGAVARLRGNFASPLAVDTRSSSQDRL
jgi:hypothetical protein